MLNIILQKIDALDKKVDSKIDALDKKVDSKIDKILKILEGHSKKHESHTKMFEKHTKMFESHTKRLTGHDAQFAALVRIVLEHSERLDRIEIHVKKIENIPTRSDLHKLYARLDGQIGRAGAIEQERVMINSAIRRHGDGIESNTNDIKRIKMHLALD